MKDFFFASDLLTLLRDDKYYGTPKNISVALLKFGLSNIDRTENTEQMLRGLVVHMIDLRGESEPFLSGTFIYPEAVVQLLKGHGLPAPAALQPASATKSSDKEALDHARHEQYFEIICRNCGTVTDPLSNAYRTPIGRLVFKTYLETRLTQGINTTARYVLEHLKDFDAEKIVTSIQEDYVTWLTEDSKEKLTSVDTIGKFILNFNRELKNLL